MTDTALDLAIERENEHLWEEQNLPEVAQPIEKLSDKVRIQSYSQLYTAVFLLELALGDISEGHELVKNTPQGDKLAGMYDQLSDFIYDLKGIKKEIWR